jgi:chromate transporter
MLQIDRKPSFSEALKVWFKIGCLSFGGPAGQIALMHTELVEKRQWISEERFLHALSFCTLLPGPEAQQLATYIGWVKHGTRGALVAGGLFVLPGALVLLVLSAIYAQFDHVPAVAAVFFGLKAAVVALVLQALIRIGRRALTSRLHLACAIAAFVALFLFEVPFPAVVVTVGMLGLVLGARIAKKADVTDAPRPTLARTFGTAALCLFAWWAPLALVALLTGAQSVWTKEATFFSETAVVTFGGAYAVLSYVSHQSVYVFGWLQPGQMLDGLGLAETTPGPLILVLEFVGFLGAYQHPGALPPLLAGTLGAAVTLWATFAPCFLWILTGAPWLETLRRNVRLTAALSLITAAVVGAIAELSLRFSVLTLFRMVATLQVNAMHVLVPITRTFQWRAAALIALALLLLFRLRVGVGWVLAACALGALALKA